MQSRYLQQIKKLWNKKDGLTFVELMIVVAIVIIISAAGVASSRGVVKNLQFQNYFNRMIFMVQEARNLAITSKDQYAVSYSVQFDTPANNTKVTVFKTMVDASNFDVEVYPFALSDFAITSAPNCAATAIIKFESSTGKTSISCDGNPLPFIELGLTDNVGKTRTFSIHQVAGIPQVN